MEPSQDSRDNNNKLIKLNNTKKKLDSARRSRVKQVKESTTKSQNSIDSQDDMSLYQEKDALNLD